jgi:hypothetical protein
VARQYAASEGLAWSEEETGDDAWISVVPWGTSEGVRNQVFAGIVADEDFATCCLLLPAELSVTYGTVYMMGLCQGMGGVTGLFEEMLLPVAQAVFPLASSCTTSSGAKTSAMYEVEVGVDALILLCKAHFLGACDAPPTAATKQDLECEAKAGI